MPGQPSLWKTRNWLGYGSVHTANCMHWNDPITRTTAKKGQLSPSLTMISNIFNVGKCTVKVLLGNPNNNTLCCGWCEWRKWSTFSIDESFKLRDIRSYHNTLRHLCCSFRMWENTECSADNIKAKDNIAKLLSKLERMEQTVMETPKFGWLFQISELRCNILYICIL